MYASTRWNKFCFSLEKRRLVAASPSWYDETAGADEAGSEALSDLQ